MEQKKQETEVWNQLFGLIDRLPLLAFGYVAAACTEFDSNGVKVELIDSPDIQLRLYRNGILSGEFAILTKQDRSAAGANRRALEAYEEIARAAGGRSNLAPSAA
jgi:hypothetical protein